MCKKLIILTLLLIAATAGAVGLLGVFYTRALPAIVQSDATLDFIRAEAAKNFNLDVSFKDVVLKTYLSPEIELSTGSILVAHEGRELVNIENLDVAISLSDIFNKKIILRKLTSDNIFANLTMLEELVLAASEAPPDDSFSDWGLKILPDSNLSLKSLDAAYSLDTGTYVKIAGKNIAIVEPEESPEKKYLRFSTLLDISNNPQMQGAISLKLDDNNRVYIDENKFFINNLPIRFSDSSSVSLNSTYDWEKDDFTLALKSSRFDAKDATRFINTNFLGKEAPELLSFFSDIKGTLGFDINMANDDLMGQINFGAFGLKIPLFADLPVTASGGRVTFDNNQVLIKDFEGYYGKSKENKATLEGHVDNYMTAANTEIVIRGRATNELAENYISKVMGVKLQLAGGDTPTRLTIKAANDAVDINWFLLVRKAKDILLEGHSFSETDKDRALRADFRLKGDLFSINSIDYYVEETMVRGQRTEPIISVSGNMSALDFSIHDLGFTILNPLPSEFLNVLVGTDIFKQGKISGNLKYIEKPTPRVDGELHMNDVRIPSQRLSIKNGVMSTDKNHILLNADGRFRRANYHFDGKIANKMTLPVTVEDVHFKLDNIDLERLLNSLNQENAQSQPKDTPLIADEDDGHLVFVPNVFVIEKANFRLDKGTFKALEFGNLDATLALDKDGNLNIQSNRFDFAHGISTLKVACDLMKNKYYIRLGAKDVDIDILATSILDLEKEITGRASALLEFNTDDKFKLNGLIKFTVKDGSITKLGLIQYVLNAASVFRNPLTMISPSTLLDLVNVPEGTFKSIDGELNIKDNIVNRMSIKSSSPRLSSFIAGRFNLETRDASLRIYTKFSNKNTGVAGVLRNVSLNSLAQKIDIGDKNTSAVYYSSEIAQLPEIEGREEDSQIFLTKVEGDVESNNFISSLRKLK
ncbi:AsmA-like C-terminal region [Candidatus Gastranaerophilus sp. (ex Termes propinquus)]|nr:AsmA-like C-terminal region [Candidatus Gastranaerophilus sp. (ex Termes propinquus)]